MFGLLALYLLVEAGHWYYLAASTVSFLGSVFVSFFLRKIFVYKNREWRTWRRQFFWYSLFWTFVAFLNVGVMYALVDAFKIGYILAQLISNTLLGLFGFSFNKMVTFRKRLGER